MARIADRLAATRRAIGRVPETALFTEAVVADVLPFCVLSVFGPGGVGKTTLLKRWAGICGERGLACISITARELEPTPEGFHAALRQAGFTGESAVRQVLLIDNYETIQPLESWLRGVFLPALSGEILVVLAGRKPVATSWRSDPDWQGLVRTLPLRNLSPEESREFLHQGGIPDELHDTLLSTTHGYPLALTIAKEIFEQRGAEAFSSSEPSPDLVQGLIERFLDDTPTPQHRAALEAAALIRVTTEPILARLLELPEDEVRPVFDWLCSLSLLESARPGIAPHSVARSALVADLRWRNPERWALLHRRARSYYGEQLARASEREQQRLLWDYVFLHRDNPVVSSAFSWQDAGAYADAPRPEEKELLRSWVEGFEGTEAAAQFDHWWNHPAQTTLVFRGGEGNAPLGFVLWLALDKVHPGDRLHDPLIAKALDFLERSAPLRPRETATFFRFWMAHDTYHGVSPIQSLVMVNTIQHYLTTPRLAYSFFPVRSPELWEPVFAYAEAKRCPAAEAEGWGVFTHDWRVQPPGEWLRVLGEKEEGRGGGVRPTPPEIYLVLSKPEFETAVRDALKSLDRPEALLTSSLLRSRVLLERTRGAVTPPKERAAVLQSLIRETAQGLQGHPKRERGYRALLHTYLRPLSTQEKAAELLDLPFSTYRRHLAEGIVLLTETLWLQEIGETLK
jgi:hypothetical protein